MARLISVLMVVARVFVPTERKCPLSQSLEPQTRTDLNFTMSKKEGLCQNCGNVRFKSEPEKLSVFRASV
jgi:hypothetical protein